MFFLCFKRSYDVRCMYPEQPTSCLIFVTALTNRFVISIFTVHKTIKFKVIVIFPHLCQNFHLLSSRFNSADIFSRTLISCLSMYHITSQLPLSGFDQPSAPGKTVIDIFLHGSSTSHINYEPTVQGNWKWIHVIVQFPCNVYLPSCLWPTYLLTYQHIYLSAYTVYK